MSEYRVLHIQFPNVDFKPYYINSKIEVNKIYNAHLYTKQEEIELRIFYDEKSYFGEKLLYWSRTINLKKFGSYIKAEVAQNQNNEYLKKIDFSEARLCGLHINPMNRENNICYLIAKIDTAKFYWDKEDEFKNTGEFYLDDKGFRVIEPFYGEFGRKIFYKNDGKFEISRKKNSTNFFKFGKSSFRPEFNVFSKEIENGRKALIIKEPKIQFKYHQGITEKDAIYYGDVVLTLASFYFHIKIDYVLRKIYLPNQKITIKNIEKKIDFNEDGNLWGFEIYWNFNKFLQAGWQTETLNNFDLISKAVTLFNHSHLVNNSSAFLIRYNIIEICGKSSIDDGIWNFTLKNDELDNFFSEMRESISNIIETTEQDHFNNKWNSIQNIIKSKSLRKQFEDSLTKNDINVECLPIRTSKIVQLRNSITHGSLDNVNQEDLRKVNILLYRICGILILNLMGIKDWKLNTEIK